MRKSRENRGNKEIGLRWFFSDIYIYIPLAESRRKNEENHCKLKEIEEERIKVCNKTQSHFLIEIAIEMPEIFFFFFLL